MPRGGPLITPGAIALAFGVALFAVANAVDAAPGDPRLVSGTIEGPQSTADEHFLVMRLTDGTRVYVDVGAAHVWTTSVLAAGDAISIIAVEGRRAYELNAIIVAESFASLDGGAASPPTDAHRLDGRVESIAGPSLVLRVNGRPITVDVARVRDHQRPRPGANVTVFGARGAGGRFVASGLVEVSAPAVPPDSAR